MFLRLFLQDSAPAFLISVPAPRTVLQPVNADEPSAIANIIITSFLTMANPFLDESDVKVDKVERRLKCEGLPQRPEADIRRTFCRISHTGAWDGARSPCALGAG